MYRLTGFLNFLSLQHSVPTAPTTFLSTVLTSFQHHNGQFPSHEPPVPIPLKLFPLSSLNCFEIFPISLTIFVRRVQSEGGGLWDGKCPFPKRAHLIMSQFDTFEKNWPNYVCKYNVLSVWIFVTVRELILIVWRQHKNLDCGNCIFYSTNREWK